MRRTPWIAFLIAALATPHGGATWSIVATDTATGEIAVGTATCLGGGDIQNIVPIVRVGVGAAAHQASVFLNFPNKALTWQELKNETDPEMILQLIDAQDQSFQTRQIGIVDLLGRAVSHTGASNQAWSGGLSGTQGTMSYAIQGNVLTGLPVVLEAEKALRDTPGALPEKLMAAMEAARAMGGDGRCSCTTGMPDDCGSPPPQFDKSAIIACMIVARIGDKEGSCIDPGGCANGEYYMNFNVSGGQAGQPDPVIQMQASYDAWRESLIGTPDHLESRVTVGAPVLPNDNLSTGSLYIEAIDWQGNPVGHGGATIKVSKKHGSDDVTKISPTVDDLGDGTYVVRYKSTPNVGKDILQVVIDDGQGEVTLYPYLEVAVSPQAFLSSPVAQVTVSNGDDVPLSLDAGAGLAGRDYLVVATVSGTDPGVLCGALHGPINPDAVTFATAVLCNSFALPNTCATLDGDGRADAALVVGPGDLAGLVSNTLHFVAITLDPEDFASEPVAVTIAP